jgi:sialate O-acetylesterase
MTPSTMYSRAHSICIAIPLALLLTSGAHRLGGQSGAASEQKNLRLPRLFATGMVVQRDKPVVVWGWAAPGTAVSVDFRGATVRAKATPRGTWQAMLPAGVAGGPFALTVRSERERIALADVFVGDVWVASGQSNMEFRLAQANNAAREIAAANDPLLRQFKVPTSWANDPADDLAGGSWTIADSEHAGDFTAVGYFFARELRKTVNVPIGIINTTWGGSNIETWMSRRALGLTDSAWAAVVQSEARYTTSLRDSLRAKLGALPMKDSGLIGDKAPWADPALDDARWLEMPVPAYWESNGFPGMDGVAWYRVSFDVSDREAASGATINVVAIDDDDIMWVNGVEVGRTTGYNVRRSYQIPRNALHVGHNLLAVRVVDGGGGGGINGAVSISFGNGAPRSLAGRWKFKVGEVSFQPDGQHTNKIPTILYNKMLHPLLPFAIKGVIWYQGESNANNVAQAAAYRGQFASLITSWRKEFGNGRDAFPFLWVQLPNYGPADATPPAQAGWATQRESMSAALALPHTGQAITIDVGDSADLHPRNKQDVGDRLARVALNTAYGRGVIASGPTYRTHRVLGDTVIVEFANVARGLTVRPADARVGGFAVAGSDRKFVWANAKIVGNRVYVWSDQARSPVAVRYAWANNPDRANLYNSEQLPTAPFRTDRW